MQAGQVSAEYLIGCLIVLALLLISPIDGTSAFSVLVAAVREGFARFAAALAIA